MTSLQYGVSKYVSGIRLFDIGSYNILTYHRLPSFIKLDSVFKTELLQILNIQAQTYFIVILKYTKKIKNEPLIGGTRNLKYYHTPTII